VLEGEAGRRIGAIYGRRGRRTLGRAHNLTETGGGPGTRGDGRRCGHKSGPRGPERDRHAANPSRSTDGARCAPPLG
jgi:hypothetical protein